MSKSDDKTLSILEDRLAELKAERAAIDEKIDALHAAYSTISGKKAPRKARVAAAENDNETPPPRKRRVMKKGRRLDKKANEKTLAFIKERKRPVTPSAVAARFHITEAAAIQRLLTLTGQDETVRVGRGKYIDKGRAPVNGVETAAEAS